MKSEIAVLFDCDGTLMDSLGPGLESFNFALARLGEPPREPEAIKKFFGRAADRIFFSLLEDESKAQRAFAYYLERQSELAGKIRLHKGIRELLEALALRGVPLAVVTGRHALDLEIVLKPHGLASYFKVLIADSDIPHSKPHPFGCLQAAHRLGFPPEKTLYVGDSVIDIQAARSAGAIPVAALWDALVNRSEMEKAGPAHLAPEAAEVLRIYQRIVK